MAQLEVELRARSVLRLIQKRKAPLITGRPNDEINLLLATVCECNPRPAQFFHIGTVLQLALREMLEDLRVHDRMRAQYRMIRLRESVLSEVADKQMIDEQAENDFFHPP